jgi:hypothetical protein
MTHQNSPRPLSLPAPLLAALCFLVVVAAAPAAAPLPPLAPLDGLGVNVHVTSFAPGELEMIKAAGFKWVRMDLTWADTEKQKGKYDFSTYDPFLATLGKQGFRALLILDYGNPLYADPGDKEPFTSRVNTDEFRQAYASWAAAAVSHFAGRGCIWEIWNEPDWKGFWAPAANVDQYIALAKAACAAIEKAAPGEPLIGPATGTINFDFIEACCKAGLLADWSALSVHPYRRHTDPSTAAPDYFRLRALIAKYSPSGTPLPIICSEWGYSTLWPGMSEAKQAEYVASIFQTNIASGIPLSIVYDWHEEAGSPTDALIHFGLVRHEYHPGRDPVFDPKPAYFAMKAFAAGLATGQAASSGTGGR